MAIPARMSRFVLVALVVASIACGWIRRRFSLPLPSRRPQDFAFEYTESGGMRPISIALACRAHACRYQYEVMGRGTPVERPVSDAQLDALYAVFRANGFHRIGTQSRGLVHDAGTTSITLHADGRAYRVAEGATEAIEPWDLNAFRAVNQRIERLRAEMFADVDRDARHREDSPGVPGG